MKSVGTNSISDDSSVYMSPISESDISLDSPMSPLSRQTSFDEVSPLPTWVFVKALSHSNVTHTDSDLIKPAYFSEIGVETLNSKDLELISECDKALKFNQRPVELENGVTGAFLMKKFGGGYAAIFKPEETLTRRSSLYMTKNDNYKLGGILHSDSSVREVAAFILDRNENGFIGVPQTLMVKVNSKFFDFPTYSTIRGPKISQRSLSIQSTPSFLKDDISADEIRQDNDKHVTQSCKIGSLQKFINHDLDAFDISASKFSTNQIHRIGIFDIRTLNSDRHEGNLLVKLAESNNYNSDLTVIPIDHGQILPEVSEFNIEGNFCWLFMKQSKEKFNEEMKEHIKKLDPFQERKNLVYMLGSRLTLASLFSLILGTILLKICVLEYDMSLYEVGHILTGQGDTPLRINKKRTSIFMEIVNELNEEEEENDISEIKRFQSKECMNENCINNDESDSQESKFLSKFKYLLRSKISNCYVE